MAIVFNAKETLEQAEAMDFLQFAEFNKGDIGGFRAGSEGVSPWEMHPECDELLYILAGEVELEILPSDGGEGEINKLGKGDFLVVPKGLWHRQKTSADLQELYITPGPTEHSGKHDPRV